MARLFAPSTERRSFTLSTSQNFVIPAGVNKIDLSGRGKDGSVDTDFARSTVVVTVSYGGTGYPLGGDIPWSFPNTDAENARAQFAAVTDGSYTASQYYNGTDHTSNVTTNSASFTASAAGATLSFSGAWSSSGNINGSGSATVHWSQTVAGSAGPSSTGFGKTFPGGAANSAAPTTTFSNVSITPGTYFLSIPAGGSITVSYDL